ncbi:MAG: hypothetical protein CVV24_00850 [Ignavibacteriae bacterium HGW-Ignavibacteriae-3]|nr:MAG: hypothetical protein CVV24_00850 [Ignavibacteriae bacterium HGW-Ignavibacteriae-3]
MRLTTNTFVTKAALVLMLAMLFVSAAPAQNTKTKTPVLNKYAVANITLGIKSESEGIRKASIDLAGKCKVDQAVDALIEQLDEENAPELRVLIAQALYNIGNEKGLYTLKAYVSSEKDPEVKRMYNLMAQEYAAGKGNVESAKK